MKVLVVPTASAEEGRLRLGDLVPSDDTLRRVADRLDEVRLIGTRVVVEDGTHGEDRATHVGQHDDAVAAVGLADRRLDALVAGAEPAVVGAAGRFHRHLAGGQFDDHLAESRGQPLAVRDQNQTHHAADANFVSICSAIPNK